MNNKGIVACGNVTIESTDGIRNIGPIKKVIYKPSIKFDYLIIL